MLQPRITPIGNRNPSLSWTLALLALAFASLAAAQSIDDLYIVRPTPALRVAAEDLTTVLLVNNENGRGADSHGRFLSVRPEVGLLTSTARTFIQEGITTEYATQVVGTTLDNGRLYAQYLKKSSRVLFENGNTHQVAPSVVTSWVGEGGGHTRSFLQNHNDLLHADAPDWQDIDDSLLRNEFVGNTDFVRLQSRNPVINGETAAKYSVSSSSSSKQPLAAAKKIDNKFDNSRKLAAQKVLPIGDLPTYTVKNHFEPSGYNKPNGDGLNGLIVEEQISASSSTNDDEDRLPKVYYQQMMKERSKESSFKAQALPLPKRVLSTITYYGFADFTTIVGDSVIVFSPSTAQANNNFGQVTSIKGKATLSVNNSPIEATIEATRVEEPLIVVATQGQGQGIAETTETLEESTTTSRVDISTPALQSEERTTSVTVVDADSISPKVVESETKASSSEIKPMLHLPTDKEILEIYASLSKAQAQAQSKETLEKRLEEEVEKKTVEQIQQSSLPVLGGATTIFFEDDPFSNFVEPTTTTTQLQLSTGSASIIISESAASTEPTTEAATTITDESLDSQTTEEVDDSAETTTKATSVDKVDKVPVFEAASVIVKEEADNGIDKEKCSTQTSQVFLTQLPKTLTILSTHVKEEQTSIETSVLSTYEIKETTKHYCIEATAVTQQSPETETPQLEIPINKEIAQQSHSSSITEASTESTTDRVEEAELTTEFTETSPTNDITTESIEHSTEKDAEDYTDDYETDNSADDEGDSTTVSSHTEIVTNIITSTVGNEQEDHIKATAIVAKVGENEIAVTKTQQADIKATKYMIPDELASLLHRDENESSEESEKDESAEPTSFLDDSKYTKTFYTTYTYYTTIFAEGETEIMSRTEVTTNYKTDLVSRSSKEYTTLRPSIIASNVLDLEAEKSGAPKELENNKDDEERITLITDVRSSSSNGDQQLISKQPEPIDDQVSSESNTDEIIPSATFLLQTSFTTFTFYTTMYAGDNTNVISRLETVTNVATETLQPTRVMNVEEATLPITYFTTFTYWTKLAKDGEITTISREETISNVIEPTNVAATSVDILPTLISLSSDSPVEKLFENEDHLVNKINVTSSTSLPDLTTFYTTYTYYTTSYEANKTITDSRFETITNVVEPMSSASDVIPTTSINVDSSIINTSSVLVYDYKHIIDAEGVSTLYFTTKIVSTDGIELTSSSSSLYIDETKKANLPTTNQPIESSTRQYKTGLVRLIEGTRIANSTTTLYQSKVIGTIIDNRYAQIIESTSSFLYEQTTTIMPTSTDNNIVPTQQINLLSTPALVESSINEDVVASHEEEPASVTEAEIDAEDADNSNKARLPFQTKKRTFAPVIRPFASRNRPTFAPKQKIVSPSSATIITRSDITPTITATPALKSVGRYSSSRKGGAISNVPINPNENLSTSSRRTFGRPIKSAIGSQSSSSSSLLSSSGFAPSRNRFASSSRIALSSSSSRRINPAFRPSSGLSYRSGFPSLNLPNARPRIKPTAAVETASSSSSAIATPGSSEEEESSSTDELNEEEETTTENSRRNQNPLLRFRRPLNRPSGFTPIPRPNAGGSSANISPRRNPLAARAKTSSTTTTTTTTARPRPRSFQRPTISSLQARARPQSNLFPPRGLFQKEQKVEEEVKESENEENETNDADYDEDDDGDEDSNDDAQRRRRSNNKSKANKRVRRQAADRSRFRFRRPKASTTTVEDLKNNEDLTETTTTTLNRSKINSRFGSRYQAAHQASSSTTTASHRAIRPTRPTSARMQFTLREKDATTKSGLSRTAQTSNFRRPPQAGSSSLRRTPPTSSNRRLKSYSNNNNHNNNVDSLRSASSSSSRTRAPSRGRGGTVRNRNRNDYNADSQSSELGSVTITVTHVIPAEVSIPVVNGQVTEYKNIVTGKTSLEVLGPHQYTNILGSNGQTSLYLTREDSTVNFAGATEITKYLLHDSATTTVTFTPTTIRGRQTSFSHVLPSTVYSVENVVTTLQPQISANAPLANILLSQLLLGNINLPANPLLAQQGGSIPATAAVATQATPVTEYRTHTSTYITTLVDGKSTVLSVTFQGKKILTTVYETTAQTITATEFLTDTIVTTPTQQQQQQLQSAGQVAQVNSLLLQQLLLQQQQQPVLEQPISHTAAPQILLTDNLQNLDAHQATRVGDNIDELNGFAAIEEEAAPVKTARKKPRKSGKNHKKKEPKGVEESSVITLYVSGRRPGEFSTILSTVQNRNHNQHGHAASLHKRHAHAEVKQTSTLDSPLDLYLSEGSEIKQLYLPLENEEEHNQAREMSQELDKNMLPESGSDSVEAFKSQTASLESIVGDVDLWYAKTTKLGNNKRHAKLYTTNLHTNIEASDHSPFVDESLEEARYNLATHIMSNGVELIIASDKLKHVDKQSSSSLQSISIAATQSHKPVTFAPSTLKNQMILAVPSISLKQQNFTIPINDNQFITKTCLTTYTYRTTYLEKGSTTVESREKVISNIATEERNYLRATTELPLGVTLSRTPELVVGVFPTTYRYYNTLLDSNEEPLVVTSSYTVVNTITGPDDYISFLQPSEEATPMQDTNTYYSRITITKTMQRLESSKVVAAENILTQVVVTESLPARSRTVLKSNYAFDTDETHIINDPIVLPTKTEESNDVHIYATKTFLTTFTYYTNTLIKDMSSSQSLLKQSSQANYHTRVIENVVTDTVPSSLLRPELVSRFRTELMQKKGKNNRKVIITVATLLGGETLEVTAVNILKPSSINELKTEQEMTKLNMDLATSSKVTKSKTRTAIKASFTTAKKVHTSQIASANENGNYNDSESESDLSVGESETNIVFIATPSPAVPSTVDQLIGSLNLKRFRPVFNAMADLLQKNLVNKRPQSQSQPQPQPQPQAQAQEQQQQQPQLESKKIPKNLTALANERPIYIPVQKAEDFANYSNNLASQEDFSQSASKLTSHSLHIQPPEHLLPELISDDSWLKEPQKMTNSNNNVSYRQSALANYQSALLNNGIPIRPGEVITANADVIIGRPNGIQFSQLPATVATRVPVPNYMEPNGADQAALINYNVLSFKKKTWLPNLPPPRVIPLSSNYSPNRAAPENYDGILKPPPPPLKHHQPVHHLPLQPLQPPQPSHHLSQAQDQQHNNMIKNNMNINIRNYNSHLYNLNSELHNNEIIEIKRIPQIFSTNLPAITLLPAIRHSQSQVQSQDQSQSQQLRPTVTYGTASIDLSHPPAYAAHQHINLKTDILSHTVKMHVPPLTFKKDTDDYPHATAVKGHISPPIMPLVKIPHDSANIQVRLSPQNSGLSLVDYGLIMPTASNTNSNIFKQRNQNVYRDQLAKGSESADRSALYDFRAGLETHLSSGNVTPVQNRPSIGLRTKPTAIPSATRPTPIKSLAKWNEISTNLSSAYHNILHKSKPSTHEFSESFADELELQQNPDQNAAYTTYNLNFSNPTETNKDSESTSLFNYYTIKDNSVDYNPTQTSKDISEITTEKPMKTNAWISISNQRHQQQKYSNNSSIISSIVNLHQGSPFEARNRSELNKYKGSSESEKVQNKNIFVATGERFKLNSAGSSNYYNPFQSNDNATDNISTAILKPPNNLNILLHESKARDVLGLKPPPPPAAKSTLPNKYATLTTKMVAPQLSVLQPSIMVYNAETNLDGKAIDRRQSSTDHQPTNNLFTNNLQLSNKLEPSEIMEHNVLSMPETKTRLAATETTLHINIISSRRDPTSTIIPTEVGILKSSSYNKISLRPTKTEKLNTYTTASSIDLSGYIGHIKTVDRSADLAFESSERVNNINTKSKYATVDTKSRFSSSVPVINIKSTKVHVPRPSPNIQQTIYRHRATHSSMIPVEVQSSRESALDSKYSSSSTKLKDTFYQVESNTVASKKSTSKPKLSHVFIEPMETVSNIISKNQKATTISAFIEPTIVQIEPAVEYSKAPELNIINKNDKKTVENNKNKKILVETKSEATIEIHPLIEPIEQQHQQKTETSTEPSSILVVMSKSNLGGSSNTNNAIELPFDELPLDYDSNISFDFPTRDEEIVPPIDSNSVLLGGVLIATPVHTKNKNGSSLSAECQPACKSNKNEICSAGANGSGSNCICRPGFARMFPDRPCKPTYTYEMQLLTNQVGNYMLKYSAGLKSNSSNEYRHLSSIILDAVDRMVMQSDFRDIYHGVQLRSFANNNRDSGVFSNFLLQLSEHSDEKRLEAVFKKYLRLSNFSIGGTELYTSKEGIEHLAIKDFDECADDKFHDCSAHAHCFNLLGSYTCSCRGGFADLSENSIYPGRQCSDQAIGCEKCNYHGNCIGSNIKTVCECFAWHAGTTCQLNLKVLLICLIAVGTVLFILLLVCILLMSIRRKGHGTLTNSPIFITSSLHPSLLSTSTNKSRLTASLLRRSSIEKHAIIKDSSSESSQNSVPYLIKNASISAKLKGEAAAAAKAINMNSNAAGHKFKIRPAKPLRHKYNEIDLSEARHLHLNTVDAIGIGTEQSDRSLTVMIPRAKYYHPSVLPHTQHQLMHHQLTMEKVEKADADAQRSKQLKEPIGAGLDYATPIGALVSAGFEVSAIVSDNGAAFRLENFEVAGAESQHAVSSDSDETAMATKSKKNVQAILHSSDEIHRMSTWMSNVQTSALSADARSCGETTVEAVTKSNLLCFDMQTQTNTNDEANTMAERDLGSTFLLPHTHLYKPDKHESDLSGFDSI